MHSFFLLLMMSLAVVSNQAKDKPAAPQVAADKTSMAKAKPVADSAEKTADAETVESDAEKIARPVSLLDKPVAPPAIAIIEAEAKDLNVQSEIDAPIIVRYFPSEKIELTQAEVAALVEQNADKPIEIKTVAAFFKNSALVEDWMNDEEKTMARRFQKFIGTLETQLENPQVYLIGERERTVIIIGKVKGGFGGVITLVVET